MGLANRTLADRKSNMHKVSLITLLLMTWIPISAHASTRYYRYSIDLTVGNQHLLEQYDLVCKTEIEIIASDFSLRRDWREGPSEIVAKDLGIPGRRWRSLWAGANNARPLRV